MGAIAVQSVEQDMRRRAFLSRAGAMAGTPFFGRVAAAGVSGTPVETRGPEALDEALERLASTGPEYGGGLANHGPMAAEALVRLGRADVVSAWVDGYRRRLSPALDGRRPVATAEWREALGDIGRVGDWAVLFERALREAPWTVVLEEWAPRLAPGLSAAACHGLIRAGHAARSLAVRDTPARRRELAQGLAYWAARYQTLPERAAPAARLRPSEAIGRVPTLPEDQRRGHGLITDRLAGLGGLRSFADVADLVDVGADGFLSDLTATFAGVYLAQARSGSLIALIHAVTGPSAVRLLLPHLSQGSSRPLLRYAWQVAAGIYAAHAGPPGPLPPAEPRETSWDALVDRAVATADEHAIKFTEACLREHAISPKPAFLTAARKACEALSS